MYETALSADRFASIPLVHGGGDGGGGLLGLLDGLLNQIDRFFEPGNSSMELLPGIQALAFNQHPVLVHFPIAFLMAFFVLEMAGVLSRKAHLRQVASWMLYLGTAAAIVTAGAGLIAEGLVPHGAEVHDVMTWHGRLGLTVAGLSLVLSIWRIAARARFSLMAQSLHLLLAGVVAACLFFGADLGGLMVYQYGVGVKGLQTNVEQHHHHAEMADRTP